MAAYAIVSKLLQPVRFQLASSDATEPPYFFSSHCCAAMRPAALGGSRRYSPKMKVEFGTGLANHASSESVKKPRMSLRAQQSWSGGAERRRA